MDNLPPGYNEKADDKQIFNHEEEPEINEEDAAIFKRYAEAREELKEVTDLVDGLGVKVSAIMSKNGMKKADLPGWGSFSIVEMPRYTYSESVAVSEEYLKGLKEDERKNGTAIAKSSLSLRFTSAK